MPSSCSPADVAAHWHSVMTDLNASAAVSPMDCSIRGDTPLGTNAWLALYVPFLSFSRMKYCEDIQMIWGGAPARATPHVPSRPNHSVADALTRAAECTSWHAGYPCFDHILNLVLTHFSFHLTALVVASPYIASYTIHFDILPKNQLSSFYCCFTRPFPFTYSPSYS